MVAKRYGQDRPRGMTNRKWVSCPKCGNGQYLLPGSGPWECNSCKETNGKR
jgi:ribosomal protein L37AE/L43A